MSLTLNTNIDSTVAQNNLNGSQALLSQSLDRLSSGLRINSAADDAAGLAISQNFTTQVNGTNQAINNANDAVSEAQTAGGALNTIVNNLQSIRTLAVESANGSNSASDRQALDQQVQQQIQEITQIASQTSFNGLSVLNGSSGTTNFQVGANVGDTISVDLSQGVEAGQIGQVATQSTTVTNAALTGNLTLAVGTGAAVTVGASVAGAFTATTGTAATGATDGGQTVDSAFAKANAINGADISGLTASASTVATESTAFSNITSTGGSSTFNLSINGVAIFGGTNNVAAGTTLTVNDVATQINLFSTEDGNVTASVAGGKLTLTASDGSNIDVSQTVADGTTGTVAGTGIATNISGGVAGAGNVNFGQLTLSAKQRHCRRWRGGRRRDRPGQRHHLTGHEHSGQPERSDGGRCEQHDLLGGCCAGNGQPVPEPVGRHPEPLHGGGQQPAVHEPEPDSVAQHDRGCELRAGNGELVAGAGVGTGRYLRVGAGQSGAAAGPQASAIRDDKQVSKSTARMRKHPGRGHRRRDNRREYCPIRELE